LLRPAPGIVGRQVIGPAVGAIFLRENGRDRHAGLVGVEEVAEAVAALVLAGRVVGVRQAGHVDDAHLLAEALLGDGFGRSHAAGDHDRAVSLDHPPRAVAGDVRVRPGGAGPVLDHAPANAITLQGAALARIENAPGALDVDVLDRVHVLLATIRTLRV